MTKWEYITAGRRLGFTGWFLADGTQTLTAEQSRDLMSMLNELGTEGWELAAQLGEELIFKRLADH